MIPSRAAAAFGLAAGLLLLFVLPAPAAEAAAAMSPGPLSEPGTADLSHIFPDWDAWEGAFRELEAAVEAFAGLPFQQGTSPDAEPPFPTAESLFQALDTWNAVHRRAAPVEGYLHLKEDLALALGEEAEAVEARRQRMEALSGRWDDVSSGFRPALLRRLRVLEPVQANDGPGLESWIEAEPGLAPYRFHLAETLRRAEHTLSEREEELLALGDLFRRQTQRLHGIQWGAEAPTVDVELSGGSRLHLDPAAARSDALELVRTDNRRRARAAWLEALGKRVHTQAALVESSVRRERFEAEARGFPSALAAALHGDAIPEAAVETLLTTARKGTEPLRRYHRLRRRVLASRPEGLEGYRPEDRFLPLGPALGTTAEEIPYPEARRLLIAAARPLGPEYTARVERAFAEGWIDAAPRPGKPALGSATFVYGRHPYVRVSYRGAVADLFRLAHELGHAVHHDIAHEARTAAGSYVTAHPSTLTAETVASVAELLLAEHLLAEGAGGNDRLAVLDLSAQTALRLFYRTVLDADFELALYEEGADLSASGLDALYAERLTAYYGDALDHGSADARGWMETPHFVNAPLYMLRYGLSYAAAAVLVDGLTSTDAAERAAARERYLALLAAGGSDHPTRLLARAGADLTRPKTIASVPERFGRWVAEMENELRNRQGAGSREERKDDAKR